MSHKGGHVLYNSDLDMFMGEHLSWEEDSDKGAIFPTLSYIRNVISLIKKRPPRKLGDFNWEHCSIIPMTYDNDNDDDYTIHYDAEAAC
jgi:hypothetical protein